MDECFFCFIFFQLFFPPSGPHVRFGHKTLGIRVISIFRYSTVVKRLTWCLYTPPPIYIYYGAFIYTSSIYRKVGVGVYPTPYIYYGAFIYTSSIYIERLELVSVGNGTAVKHAAYYVS